MSTTQQHWLTHPDGLFLVYTRKDATNANVIRWRSPLFMAQVDPATLRLRRATERVVLPLVGDGVNDPDRVAIMDAMVKPLRDDEGKVIMVVASGIDVTAQREAAADLERTTSLLRAVIDSSPDWIFAKDREHRYLLVNRTFAAAFGREPQDMVGHRDSEFFPARLVEGDAASGRRGFHDTDEEALGGSVVRVVLEVETADGRGPRQIETVKAALRDASGAPYGTLSLSRDLTERVAMEVKVKLLITAQMKEIVPAKTKGRSKA